MDLDFVTAFGSEYIKQSDGGRKLDHHLYRVCVEALERHDAGQKLSLAEAHQLYLDIQDLEKKDKKMHLLAWYNRVFAATGVF